MDRTAKARGSAIAEAHVPLYADLPPILIVVGILAVIPGGLFPFVWLKIVLLAAAVLMHAAVPVRRGQLTRLEVILLIAGVAWLFLVALLSDSQWPSIAGRWPRYEGLPVIAAYAASVFIGAHVLGPGGGRAWDPFRKAVAVASLTVGGIAVLEAMGFRPLGGALDVRPGSTLGNATDLGLAALLFAGVLIPQALSTRSRLLIAGAGASAITVGLSGSRAALLGLLVTITVLGAAHALHRAPTPGAPRWPTRGTPRWPTLAVVAAVALTAALAVPAVRDRLASTSTITGRVHLWNSTLDLASTRLLVGTGPSGFVDALPPHLSREAAIHLGSQTVHDSPHMWVLQATVAGGLVLASITLLLATRTIGAGVRILRSGTAGPEAIGAVAALAGYGVGLLTHFTSPVTTPFAALLAGVVLATAAPAPSIGARGGVRTWGGRILTGSTATILACTALAASLAEWSLKSATDTLAEGDPVTADTEFERAATLRPWDSDTALVAAQAFATAASSGVDGAPELAVTWADRALASTPDSVEAGLALAVGQLNGGEIEAAVATLDGLAARAPHTFLVHVQRGIARFGLADVDGAVADLEEATELDPRSPLPWTVLARIHERLGDVDSARDAWQQAEVRGN